MLVSKKQAQWMRLGIDVGLEYSLRHSEVAGETSHQAR